MTHTNKRSFLCETCGSSFKTKSAVKRHTLTVHNDIKKYKCDNCNKKFTSEASLMRHLKSAEGKCRPDLKTKLSTEEKKLSELQSTMAVTDIKLPIALAADLFNNPNQLILHTGQGFNVQIIPPLQPQAETIASTEVGKPAIGSHIVNNSDDYTGDMIIQQHFKSSDESVAQFGNDSETVGQFENDVVDNEHFRSQVEISSEHYSNPEAAQYSVNIVEVPCDYVDTTVVREFDQPSTAVISPHDTDKVTMDNDSNNSTTDRERSLSFWQQ